MRWKVIRVLVALIALLLCSACVAVVRGRIAEPESHLIQVAPRWGLDDLRGPVEWKYSPAHRSTPTPDRDVVDEIGKALGVSRDVHRWELDPASAEDYIEQAHAAPQEAEEIQDASRTPRKAGVVKGV